MKVRLDPARLRGTVRVPTSKSLLHRHLICQALAGEYEAPPPEAEDVQYTVRALEALRCGEARIDCGMSGSTLRFLLPLAMARGQVGATFTGDERLLTRPIGALLPMERTASGWRVTGRLTPGSYRLTADETSQTLSGLMMALPLLDAPSKIMLTTKPVSKPYLDMTLAVMARHGVSIEEKAGGYIVPAPQSYRKYAFTPEGDWSAAAWYTVMNALQGQEITVENIVRPSLQGDSRIADYVNSNADKFDLSATPDLLPPLALWAVLRRNRVTRFSHVGFLRGKESDRLRNTARILNALGGCVREETDGLTVIGAEKLHGGAAVDGHRDHRMVMLAAFAAVLCEKSVTLTGAEFADKSYRAFWRDYISLGGKMEVLKP